MKVKKKLIAGLGYDTFTQTSGAYFSSCKKDADCCKDIPCNDNNYPDKCCYNYTQSCAESPYSCCGSMECYDGDTCCNAQGFIPGGGVGPPTLMYCDTAGENNFGGQTSKRVARIFQSISQ